MEINDIQGNYGDGWIKLFRSIRKHWIWEDANKLKWWLDILLEVNHSDTKVAIGYQILECKRGESLNSVLTWGKRWGVSKKVAYSFLKMLQNDSMIELKSVTVTTHLTVCNYESYQDIGNANGTQRRHKRNAKETQEVHKQEGKELKKEKKEFIIPELSEIETYFDTNGYRKDAAKKFLLYYTETKWINKNGKPIENWKLTAQSVWFNEKNKKPERILPI